MNDIKVEEVKGPFEGFIISDVQQLKKHLDNNFLDLNNNLIDSAIQETESLIRKAANSSSTYRERYLVLDRMTKLWADVWQRYNHLPEAFNLGMAINQITDHTLSYSYFYRSLSLINENRTEDENKNLEQMTLGFLLLSEVLDVFIDFFTNRDVQAIYSSAKHVMDISVRTPWAYFDNGFELSNLTTQLRAYSSLIILRIDESRKIESLSLDVVPSKPENNPLRKTALTPAWKKIDGAFASSHIYEDAIRLGQAYRQSPHTSVSTEDSNA